MKKLIPLLLIILVVAIINLTLPTSASFIDVPSEHPNSTAIDYVQSQGIVEGYPDGTFQPSRQINRAEFTKIIIEATFDQATIDACTASTFSDVPTGEWFTPYICVAKNQSLIDGYPDGTFQPGSKINFVESAKIISNAMKYQTATNEIWYKPFVEQLSSRSAIPTSIQSFSQQITRAEMAEMIFRLKSEVTNKSSQTYESLSGTTPENTQAYKPELVLSQADLLALADDKYSNGEVPLGDKKYTLDSAQKGYIYLCHEMPLGGGAQLEGPWIGDNTWDFDEKISVGGAVEWTQAFFSNVIEDGQRMITGNGLPTTHATGIFPISRTEEGYQYDRNPNTISETNVSLTLPAQPTYSDTPYCMPTGEVGIMLNGVAIFNGMDAEQRDAPAHEVQDSCDGHPQEQGQYHYHSLSSCFDDIQVSTVLGYANDGFPITGPEVSDGKYLTTEDLDECHGITSEIKDETGKTYTTYHYVMTYDYPYSVGCYRSEPAVTAPTQNNGPGTQPDSQSTTQPNGTQSGPPQEAFTACESQSSGSSCSFSDNGHEVTGTCRQVPEGFVCAP